MKSMKLTSALTVAMIAGGIGFSSISADAVAPQQTTGKVTFTPGELTLDKVPSFDFGTQQITTQTKDYDAQEQSKVQVTDLRGSSAGWTLTVTAGKLKTTSMKELVGTQIVLQTGQASNNNGEAVIIPDTIYLNPEQSEKVMNATAGNGNGVSTGTWQSSDVKLFVPGTTTKSAEQYTADLTWTLTDAPAP
ncbi:WxL domain-containing protein [Enterococcus faecalis]|uniref:WxL domain-containing protein n=1 Tax=Enterococcus faecalis TaxID=1351 RepID=UPI001A966C3B|nr:WxL domain-containing protein [Enterococcus faecalis]MBO1103943.1 WxL domain-containing protein [Enterococcus faecalis]